MKEGRKEGNEEREGRREKGRKPMRERVEQGKEGEDAKQLQNLGQTLALV